MGSRPSAPSVGLVYDRLEKVHELVWKQRQLHIAGFTLSEETLMVAEASRFQAYYETVGHLHHMQWIEREDRIHRIVAMQKALDQTPLYPSFLMELDAPGFSAVFQQVLAAHQRLEKQCN